MMYIWCYIGNGKITNYSNLRHLQINVDTILFSNRQFDSLFDVTHTVIGVTCAYAQLPHSPITSPSQPPTALFTQHNTTLIHRK